MTSRALRILTVAFAVLAGACAGPKAPLDLSMREVGVDLVGAKPPAITLPADAPPPRVPSVPLPAVTVPPPKVPALVLCPKADQFAVPALEAFPLIQRLPTAASYLFRAAGKVSTGGALPVEAAYPPFGKREVVRGSEAKGYDFAVAELVPKRTTAYTLVRPSASLAAQQGGLYIAAMDLDDPIFGKLTFRPIVPMLFMQLPLEEGTSYASAGVDPEHRIVAALNGRVAGRRRIDACGSLIDTWELRVTQVIQTAAAQLNVTATYWIAPQYGGLAVSDVVEMSAVQTNGLAPTATSSLRSVINSVPEDAR